jgi:hypothetical protein
MPLTYVTGDPTQTDADALAFGYNLRARHETTPLQTALFRAHPAAFSAYRKQARQGRLTVGQPWIWRDSTPKLVFWIVRMSSVGATRLRYVQSCALKLARDYRLDGIQSLAIAPLGTQAEWPEIKLVLETWLAPSRLPVTIYEADLPTQD